MKIHPLIVVAALTVSLTGCVIDPAMLSGLYGNQQPASYGYQASAYEYGPQPSLSYGYRQPTTIYAPAPHYRAVFDGGRHERPHDRRFGRHHDRH